jgi:hypothetical protein
MSDQGQVIASQPEKTLHAIENGDDGEKIAENLQQAQDEVPRSRLDQSLVRIDQEVDWVNRRGRVVRLVRPDGSAARRLESRHGRVAS